MTATHKNFLKTTISAVASSGLGAFTISTASSGYRTFGSGDDGKTFDGITIKEGTAWEVRDGCVYTHSGTSLSRGTLMDSSTGSAIAFTSAAVVSQGGTAEFAGRVEQVALRRVTGTDASITLEANTHYTWDLSILTADRNATLPTTAAIGDVIEVFGFTDNASYELIFLTGSGQTCALAGTVVAASTEITRIFIAGESMRFVYEDTNKWVAYDGRIPQTARMSLITTDIATNSAATWTKTNMNSADYSRGCVIDVATNRTITWRRASRIFISGSWQARSAATLTDNEQCGWACSYGGVPGVGTLLFAQTPNHPGTTGRSVVTAGLSNAIVPAGSALQHSFITITTANAGCRALTDSTFLSLLEVF